MFSFTICSLWHTTILSNNLRNDNKLANEWCERGLRALPSTRITIHASGSRRSQSREKIRFRVWAENAMDVIGRSVIWLARIWQRFSENTILFIKIKCKYLANQRVCVVLALHVAIVYDCCCLRCRCAMLCQQRQHSKQWAKDKRQGNNKTQIHFAQEICMLITLWYSN